LGSDVEKVAGLEPESVEPGVWRYGKARRASLVVDGEDYFALIQQAMVKAKRRILLIGWDFDTRIHLSKGRRWWQKGRRKTYPSRLGSFVVWLARHNKELDIKILKWSVGFLKWFARGYMLADIMRWMPHKRIAFKFDNSHPVGGCHHQKIVVIDDDFAVCGGIDLTAHRWDTRKHVEDDPQRGKPGGRRYGPWHDMTMMMEGEVAGALDELGRTRWLKAGGGELGVLDPQPGSAWPDELEAQFENVEIGIARTSAAYDGYPQVEESANCSSIRSRAPGTSFMPKTSISPHAILPRRLQSGCSNPIRRKLLSFTRKAPTAGWNVWRWTQHARGSSMR